MARLAKKTIKSHLAEFESASMDFARLANALVEKGNALAHDPLSRARVQQLIERARIMQKAVQSVSAGLGDVKMFLGELAGADAGKSKLFIESSDTVMRALTRGLAWFNADCETTIERLENGTLSKLDLCSAATPSLILAIGAGLLFLAKKEKLLPTHFLTER